MPQTFEATLHGRLLMCSTYTQADPFNGKPIYTHLRVVAKQDNGTLFEAVQVVGLGTDAVTRAALLKSRMKPGCRIEAHGGAVCITRGQRNDPPRLWLQNVEYIRAEEPAGEGQEPTTVHSILGRLASRVPAVARGMAVSRSQLQERA
jgi:hypothetical protein